MEQSVSSAPVPIVLTVVIVVIAIVVGVKMAFSPNSAHAPAPPSLSQSEAVPGVRPAADEAEHFVLARREMVRRDLAGRDINDRSVLEVMGRVARQKFVPATQVENAYADRPLPIGHGQTISQPYIVALMTQLARPKPASRALDIGTGSGYQAAVLAELCRHVYSIEIIEPLAEQAKERIEQLGYENITVRCADGYRGWPQHAPFDVIIVAAAPDHVPQPLVDQLAPGGRLVIPVGRYFQRLLLIEKQPDGSVRRRSVTGVSFVPMTGEANGKD